MRVIGGASRGRTLRAPVGRATRPTSDRVRESIFDILQSLVDLEDASVVDLFAGSGALGIEALSRGAARAVFVDHDHRATEAIRANLRSSGLDEAAATVVREDVATWLARRAVSDGPFDLALCDPPYGYGAWSELLGLLPAHWAVLESDVEPPPVEGWEVARSRRYGGTLVTVVRATAPTTKGSP